MNAIDDTKLMTIVAEEVEKPDFPTDEFAELLSTIGEAASSTVKACVLAIALFQEAQRAVQHRFAGSRDMFQKTSVCAVFERYTEIA